jgi:hypothetical protein
VLCQMSFRAWLCRGSSPGVSGPLSGHRAATSWSVRSLRGVPPRAALSGRQRNRVETSRSRSLSPRRCLPGNEIGLDGRDSRVTANLSPKLMPARQQTVADGFARRRFRPSEAKALPHRQRAVASAKGARAVGQRARAEAQLARTEGHRGSPRRPPATPRRGPSAPRWGADGRTARAPGDLPRDGTRTVVDRGRRAVDGHRGAGGRDPA